MRPAKSAIDKINQAILAGKNVYIAYTDRDPEQAMRYGVLPRAMKPESEGGGRTVPLHEFANQHTSVRDSMAAIQERYKNNDHVFFQAFDNSGKKGEARLVDLSDLPEHKYKTPEELIPVLKRHLDEAYQKGEISKKIYLATLGGGGDEEAKEIGI
jgi:hypothetical protein